MRNGTNNPDERYTELHSLIFKRMEVKKRMTPGQYFIIKHYVYGSSADYS